MDCVVVHSGKTQNARRREAYTDLYASYNLAAIMHAVQDLKLSEDPTKARIKSSNMYNIDAVSALIGKDRVVRLIVSKTTKKKLKEMNIAPASASNRKKERGIRMVFVTGSDGSLVAAFIIIKDRNIKQLKTVKLQSAGEGKICSVYLILTPVATTAEIEQPCAETSNQVTKGRLTLDASVPVEISDVDLTADGEFDEGTIDVELVESNNHDIVERAHATEQDEGVTQDSMSEDEFANEVMLISEAMEIKVMRLILVVTKDVIIERRKNEDMPLKEISVDETNPEFGILEDDGDDDLNNIGRNISESSSCLLFDGEHFQIESLFQNDAKLTISYNKSRIELIKLPGGSSFQYQPNDVMRAHQIVHDSIKKLKVAEFHKPPYLDEAIALMKRLKIEKSSRDCFQTFLAQVPLILSKAFGVSTIRDGWRRAGLVPLNIEVILTRCSAYQKLTADEKAKSKVAMTKLISIANDDGIITDMEMSAALSEIPRIKTPVTNMDQRTFNQQRTLWFNKEAVMLKRKEVEQRRLADIAVKEAKLAKEEASVIRLTKNHPPLKFLFHPSHLAQKCFTPGCTQRRKAPVGPDHDDGWKACSVDGCNPNLYLFCHQKRCEKLCIGHIKDCLEKNDN